MRDGFVSVAAVTPKVRVADVAYNVAQTEEAVRRAADAGARVVVLPELGLTGYTCEDLFWQDALLDAALEGLVRLADDLADVGSIVACGLPVRVAGKLYNCAAVLYESDLLALVPKHAIPTYNEFYEMRHFTPGPLEPTLVDVGPFHEVPFGSRVLVSVEELPELVVGFEVCEDLWVPEPPSIALAQAGATLICNLSASNEVVGKSDYRRDLVRGQSARLVCGYAYASAGWGESTTDLVFGGHDLVCEDGTTLAEARPFGDRVAISEVDVKRICAERRRMSTFEAGPAVAASGGTAPEAWVQSISMGLAETSLTRFVDPQPFVPSDVSRRAERCETIFRIQAAGLAKRLEHTRSSHAVVGVSGGLDSTLALLVTSRAFDLLGRGHEGILAITMPGFGTTKRTHGNAERLAEALGAELREIPIGPAVERHFQDIGHDPEDRSVTYENAQARERTQILMDVANKLGGLVVGTGDLSELALGWATYNADHMSMYGVNAGVPKTLVRHLVRYVADTCGDPALEKVLLDVLDTPVSPELLPASADGTIAQRTEDLVGPYELHDFFLYNMLRMGFGPRKVFRLARVAFDGSHGADTYDDATILKWLKVFYRRFFAQQFKRSCLPDGPKVGSVAVSPRGDLRMPSDACATLWLDELERL
jgi:NAD+ synthase (glutamine-hydrolysing)